MSLQWTLIATFLYTELAIILIFLTPIIKPGLWRKLLRSRFLSTLAHQSNLYLYAFIGVLLLFFVESIREFHKYSSKLNSKSDGMYLGSAAYYEDQMRLFRGQRNFYISGMALFALFIIKRLANLNSELAQAKAEAEASLKQAASASQQASKNLSSSGDDIDTVKLVKENNALKEEAEDYRKTIKKLENSLEALKKQSQGNLAAFDSLTEEMSKMQNEKVKELRKDK